MQRKATKNTRGPNSDEKLYHCWIKESNYCVACCENKPVICHHAEGATFRHNKVLIGHWFCIGLCQDCDNIITLGSRRKFREEFGPQSEMWEKSINLYHKDIGAIFMTVPFEVCSAILDWGK